MQRWRHVQHEEAPKCCALQVMSFATQRNRSMQSNHPLLLLLLLLLLPPLLPLSPPPMLLPPPPLLLLVLLLLLLLLLPSVTQASLWDQASVASYRSWRRGWRCAAGGGQGRRDAYRG